MNPAEEYILNQPEPFRTILLQLQSLIEQSIPGVSLKYRYRIPFYYLNGRPFCYLNRARDYVDLGIPHAYRLTRHISLMESRGRKTVKSLRYRKAEDIDSGVLLEVLEDMRQQNSLN